jgi:succinate dehydrogenase / fumarate reductase cytochrome b subunit
MSKNNDLGIRGWFYAGRYGPQRYAYTLQRITGTGIILYLLIHIFVTGTKIFGGETWNRVVVDGLVGNPVLHLGEFLLFMAVLIHGVNGFRLMLVELGFFLGKPFRNIYPYETCLDRNRGFLWFCVVVIAALAAVGVGDFFNII